MIVRKLKKTELDRVCKIYEESFGIINSQIDYKIDNIYVICYDDLVVGLCMLDYIDDFFLGKRTCYINSVCVDSEYRRRGIATFMLEEIEKICCSNNVNEIMLTSSSSRVIANKLYKKLNYNIYDTNVFKKQI